MAHFEIYIKDVEAAKEFYGHLFDWTFEAMPGAEEVNYHLAFSEEIGPEKPLSVGLLTRPDDTPDAGGPVRGGAMTFEVADCDASYVWALNNGGAEALPPTDYPGIGRAAYVEDGQGNIVGMITPSEGS
ncbi:hypothetical protein F9L33_04695 [Amylibacter sp. SFDW26]|uniref:VOC family protein n=1 Tax=Amylibacter sp. SFDW26 TaxID=2652722 RepID=UPI001261EC9A|nr:VOC family protein [Amylibacter sp. SFDW26]KAB7616063.1 hypothetical protein F9L33_04695 [Amylibacter sp. SFDW26]